MKNKLISLLLGLSIVLSTFAMVSVSAFAADMEFTVEGVKETESTVQVEIGIKGNKGFSGLDFQVEYDSSVLTPVDIEVVGAADKAQMTYMDDATEKGNYNVIVYGDKDVNSNGKVCVVTFEKGSGAHAGTSSNIKVVANEDCYSSDGTYHNVKDGDAKLSFTSFETTTKKNVTTTKKNVTTTKKNVTTTKKNSVKTTKRPVAATLLTSPTMPETTTLLQETTTLEEWTEYPEEALTYESYSYVEPETEATEEDEDAAKKQQRNRIIAIVVIVICVSAVAALIFTKKKSPSETRK
ncbi:MAG: hypothetical protein IJ279_01845 [Clostridia bacterium]|nr:hypothetical protein [Clostridia bacterium]